MAPRPAFDVRRGDRSKLALLHRADGPSRYDMGAVGLRGGDRMDKAMIAQANAMSGQDVAFVLIIIALAFILLPYWR